MPRQIYSFRGERNCNRNVSTRHFVRLHFSTAQNALSIQHMPCVLIVFVNRLLIPPLVKGLFVEIRCQ